MARQIRVAMLTRDYPPKIGGIPTHVYNLVSHLRRNGVTVDVFEGVDDVRTLLLPFNGNLRHGAYDVVHVQSLPYGAFVSQHPCVVTVHSPISEEGRYYGFANLLKRPAASILEKRAVSRADALIAVSATTRLQLAGFPDLDQRKVSLILNGVDTLAFNPSRKTPESSRKILMCSRLDPRKNIGEAIEALGEVDAGLFELEIVGEGPERAKLMRLLHRFSYTARFSGIASDERLHECFSSSGIFLSTSLSEGFGISVLQAMAAGCAVVVSDIPAHRELVTDSQEGLIYSDKRDLVEKIRLLLSDDQLLSRLGKAARATALRYSWERVADETEKVYLRLLGES